MVHIQKKEIFKKIMKYVIKKFLKLSAALLRHNYFCEVIHKFFVLDHSIWASSCKNKAECNELHPSVSVVQVIIFI